MLNKVDENLKIGQYCLENGSINAAANRLYYAVFQTLLMWATKEGKHIPETGKHRALIKYIEGPKSIYFKKIFKRLMQIRETADYEIESIEKSKLDELKDGLDDFVNYYKKKAGY
ncbi:HEPN domain-containing protein [Myxococcota bacterium]|nr:HEPN domain-containing protein [Myxococcota bacterium]MBU1382147.1 HEPN domain-containing protein [Myxococcota bacterium]MBU1495918.1 HEPN domain-containing protein [Myxococcota bacterium]